MTAAAVPLGLAALPLPFVLPEVLVELGELRSNEGMPARVTSGPGCAAARQASSYLFPVVQALQVIIPEVGALLWVIRLRHTLREVHPYRVAPGTTQNSGVPCQTGGGILRVVRTQQGTPPCHRHPPRPYLTAQGRRGCRNLTTWRTPTLAPCKVLNTSVPWAPTLPKPFENASRLPTRREGAKQAKRWQRVAEQQQHRATMDHGRYVDLDLQ